MKSKPEVGARVRMSAEFLRNTGQYSGAECFNVWTVQACECDLCKGGPFVLTNEPRIKPAPDEPTFRHINYNNLRKVR